MFYREIDFDKGVFIGEGKIIINHEGKLTKNKSSNSAKFNLKTSKDKSKILIRYQNKLENDFMFAIFDSSLNSVWKYTISKMKYKNYILDFIIGNNNVYIVSKVYDNSKINTKTNKSNYHIEFFETNISSDKIKISKINIEEKFITHVKILQHKENIYCAGFYYEDKKTNKPKGLFSFMKKNEDSIIKKYYKIPNEILNQYVYDDKKTKKKAFNNLILKDFFNYNDGIIIIGEVIYFKSNGNYGTNDVTSSYYENILVAKISLDGELRWMRKIPKRQRSNVVKKGGMSYSYFNTNNNHYITFIDNIKNYNLPLNKKPALHLDQIGGYLATVKINDSTGETTKSYLLELKRINKKIKALKFKTDNIVKINNNMFFVEFYKRKKEDVFLKIELKEK